MTDVVTISGLTFQGDSYSELTYSQLAGWDGVTDARGKGDSIPDRHGQYGGTDVLRESRAISLKGAIIADSAERFFELKRMVENMPSIGEMRVDQGDGTWSRTIEVESITIPDFHLRTNATFTIDMVAPDPVRYRDVTVLGPVGLPVLEGGLFLPESMPWDLGTDVRSVLTVVNEGTVPVYPVVRLSGSASSVTVLGGPRRVAYGAFVGDLVFDAADRRAFLNGSDVTRQMTRRDWPVVPAGVTHEFTFEAVSPSPDFRMSVEYRIGAW